MATNNQPQPQEQQQGGSVFSKVVQGFVRLMIMYTISQYIFGGFGAKKNSEKLAANTVMQQTIDPSSGKAIETPMLVQQPSSAILQNLFPQNCLLNMYAFLSNESFFDYQVNQEPFWSEESIAFNSDATNSRKFSVNMTRVAQTADEESSNSSTSSSSSLMFKQAFDLLTKNQTVYLHMFFVRQGVDYRPNHPQYKSMGVHSIVKPLNKFMKQKKNKKRNLLQSSNEIDNSTSTSNTTNTSGGSEQQQEDDVYLSYLNPEISVSMVDFHDRMTANGVPPHIYDQLKIRQHKKAFMYEPIIYVNDFWVIRDRMMVLNETVDTIPLSIEIVPTSTLKWQFFIQMQVSLDMQKSFGSMADGEGDQMKKLFLESNPYLLGITMVVSIFHSIFDFLAFKNDISFWKNKENMEGMSVKSIFVNCFFQTLIFLYLFDNDTSWLILGSSFVGLLIEYWKLKKAVNFKRKSTFPFITYEDKNSYTASKTKEYDDEAMRYISYLLYPLIVLYALYSLYYESHKSWYSWILGTAVGFIYMFGFIMMLPQLFINYKMKSVAHLPWKTFMYKALNTFIDDLFSFVIKMPTLHRLACFRDDIVFFIYLYQRWIYKVDYTRVNEFGQCVVNPDEPTPENTEAIEATPESDQKDVVVEEAVANEAEVKENETEEKSTQGLRKRNTAK